MKSGVRFLILAAMTGVLMDYESYHKLDKGASDLKILNIW